MNQVVDDPIAHNENEIENDIEMGIHNDNMSTNGTSSSSGSSSSSDHNSSDTTDESEDESDISDDGKYVIFIKTEFHQIPDKFSSEIHRNFRQKIYYNQQNLISCYCNFNVAHENKQV